ncbi:hypothetical protein [Micromonospora sp. NPDC005367]|uniref:hypothetical protein n=1 Tax=Micromonospora sp. NPDC005367 TaxID=3155590 RepID=UPI0033BD5587
MDRKRVDGWIAAYEQAWRTPGTDPLVTLFTADASYRNAGQCSGLQAGGEGPRGEGREA